MVASSERIRASVQWSVGIVLKLKGSMLEKRCTVSKVKIDARSVAFVWTHLGSGDQKYRTESVSEVFLVAVRKKWCRCKSEFCFEIVLKLKLIL